MSESSIELCDHSITTLEQRIEDEMHQPIKKFGGLNNIRLCGKHARCFMGHKPLALVITGLMINIPATFFNTAIAPVPLWDGTDSTLLLVIGIILQITCNVLMIWTSVVDPGIVPATHISLKSISKIDIKYLSVKSKG